MFFMAHECHAWHRRDINPTPIGNREKIVIELGGFMQISIPPDRFGNPQVVQGIALVDTDTGLPIPTVGLLPSGTSITRSESLAGNVLTETFTYASGATTIGTVVVVTTAGKFTSATWS